MLLEDFYYFQSFCPEAFTIVSECPIRRKPSPFKQKCSNQRQYKLFHKNCKVNPSVSHSLLYEQTAESHQILVSPPRALVLPGVARSSKKSDMIVSSHIDSKRLRSSALILAAGAWNWPSLWVVAVFLPLLSVVCSEELIKWQSGASSPHKDQLFPKQTLRPTLTRMEEPERSAPVSLETMSHPWSWCSISLCPPTVPSFKSSSGFHSSLRSFSWKMQQADAPVAAEMILTRTSLHARHSAFSPSLICALQLKERTWATWLSPS